MDLPTSNKRIFTVHLQTQTRAFDTEGAGSSYATGFIVDKKRGIILTNRHVVTPGKALCVLPGSQWLPAGALAPVVATNGSCYAVLSSLSCAVSADQLLGLLHSVMGGRVCFLQALSWPRRCSLIGKRSRCSRCTMTQVGSTTAQVLLL